MPPCNKAVPNPLLRLPYFVPTPEQEAELAAAHLARFGFPARAEYFRLVPLCVGMEEWLRTLEDCDRLLHWVFDLYMSDPGNAAFARDGEEPDTR